jgi:nucleoside-triphosphatase
MPLLQQHHGRKRHPPTILKNKKRVAGVNLKKAFFLTGHPGVGKTTVLTRIVDELKRRGFKVGGMVTNEVKENGERVGFTIVNLSSGTIGWLARTSQHSGPQIGRYHVCLEDLESVGVKAILDAVACADVVVIDEVGPMELFSASFRDAVMKALESGKTVLGTIHYRATHPLVVTIKNRSDTEIIEVTTNNRSELPMFVTQEILKNLSKS